MTAHRADDPSAGAAETLRHVDHVRHDTRRLMNAAWFPMLLWGAIVLASAPIALASDTASVIYWIVAAPAGLLLTIAFFRRRSSEHGLIPRYRKAYPAVGVGIALASGVLGGAGGETVSAVGPLYAVAAGMLVLAALGRVPLFAGASLALIVAATSIVVADPRDPHVVAALVEGTLLAGSGLAILIGERLHRGRGPGTARAQVG